MPSPNHFHQASAQPVRLTWRTLGFGLTGALVSALATAVLILINGSVTLILLNGFIHDGPEWLQRPSPMQFILFCVPLAMVVVQWMIWDAVVDRLKRPAR